MHNPLPKLVTFDGEARSGKGTVVGLVKDYLRDERSHKVMLIDAGQVFRVLVVAMMQAGVNLDAPEQIDAYLSDDGNIVRGVQFVKRVYRMPKQQREALLYTNDVSVNSAKVGARGLSQAFKDNLLRKWLSDARMEGFDTILLDGRALEEVGEMLENEGYCEYALTLYFVCDPVVSAQRTLGHMPRPYEQLDDALKVQVDQLVAQIHARNESDKRRAVQPVVPPANTPTYPVVEVPVSLPSRLPRPAAIIDRSAELPLNIMVAPLARLIAKTLDFYK
ncbi:MAG: (d)CMP kinase [Candidatus Saccharimonas sp.]